MKKFLAVFGLFFLLTTTENVSGQEEDENVVMETSSLLGQLFNNCPQDEWFNLTPRVNGYRYFEASLYPERNLFWKTGFYLEHVFNGCKADQWRQNFTPEYDPCVLSSSSPNAATLFWTSTESTWGIECSMAFRLNSYFLDMTFRAKPTENVWPKGWLGFMWANYVDAAIDRRIYFWGRDPSNNQWGWCSYGDSNGTAPGGGELIDQGIIPLIGSKDLPFDPWSPSFPTHNFSDDYEGREFRVPLYYGLVDGDGNFSTTGDTMCFLMMFDQWVPIRFALFNFSGNTHRPAWDWQYIVRNPQIGKTYSYRARFAYFPWRGEGQGRIDVLKEFYKWRISLNFAR